MDMNQRMAVVVRRPGQEGQAMVELIIALVVFMVLVAGIIQIGTIGKRHTEMMNDAREEAAVEAMKDVSPFSSPEFMADRLEGDDAVRYSRDDGYKAGFVDDFQNGIVEYADPDALEQRRRGNVVSEMAGTPFPHLLFGLVEGRADDTVELWPVVRRLLYQADSVDVEGRVWLVWTKGIY
jgi:hypothetical protein